MQDSLSVNIQKQNITVAQIFKTLHQQTGLIVFYNNNMLNDQEKMNVHFKHAGVKQVMDSVVKDKGLSYTIKDRFILLKVKTKKTSEKSDATGPSSAIPKITEAPATEITGIVTDKQGNPLAGVTVVLKSDHSVGTITNADGSYSITVPDQNGTLIFRYLGFKNLEVSINGRSKIDVQLLENLKSIDEVVVTGYRDIRKQLFTGSSTTLSVEDVERPGMSNVSQMLEGQFAGVSVQNVSGTFGTAPKLRIRGATSLSGDNKPLWVIDGVVVEDVVNISNEALSTGDMNTLLGSSVAGINPSDIKSITILRDAAATALYGARAMNGVVVVTTKKGAVTNGKPRINYTGNFTTYIKPSYANFDVLNSADQMSVMMEMYNKGYFQMPGIINGKDGGVFYKMYNQLYDYDPQTKTFALRNNLASRNAFLERYANANTDWFDLIFKNSLKQEHSISISSGTENFRTYASISYLRDNGQTIGNKVERYTGNFRANFNVGRKFSGEVLTSGSIRNQRAPGTEDRQSEPVYGTYLRGFDINPYNFAMNTSRMITPYDENGNLEYFRKDYAPFNIINELNTNYMKLHVIDFKIQGKVSYNILPELKYSALGAFRYVKSENQVYVLENSNRAQAYRAASDPTTIGSNEYLYDDPDNAYAYPMSILPSGGFYNVTMNNLKSYYFRQELNYNKTINNKHIISLFGSMEMRSADRQNEFFDGVGYQYGNGGLVHPYYMYFKQAGEQGKPYFGMSPEYERFLAFMFQGSYSYDDRYVITPTIRYDGSNKMGESKVARWLPTWNISAKWNLFREDFWPKNNILTSALLRGSYGLTANIGNATNSAAVFYNRIARRPFLNDQEPLTYISSLANSQLTWEKSKDLDIGIELGFWRNRMNITVDYYNREIRDLIGAIETSGIGGQYTKYGNYATMHGHGVEFSIDGSIFKNKNFSWISRFNFAFNKNKITRLDVDPDIWRAVSANGAPIMGHPQRGLFAIQFAGLDHYFGYPTYIGIKTDKADRPVTTYINLQSDKIDNLTYMGPVDPITTGGFYNRINFKGFSLSGLLKFSYGNVIRLPATIKADYSDMQSMTKDMLNRWVMPGDENKTSIPALMDDVSKLHIVDEAGGQVDAKYPYNLYNYSTERVVDGDYIKLVNLSLGYNFPQRWYSKLGMTHASIHITANNLWVIYADERLNGQDPEFFASGGVALPSAKRITLSLKIGF